MITLRELARRDRAIAAITSQECKTIAEGMDFLANFTPSKLLLWLLLPKSSRKQFYTLKENQLCLRMIAATLGRTPEEKKSLQAQIEKEIKDSKIEKEQ